MTVLRSGSATDVGRVRTVNQDLALETANLFAVADGMGGHVGGEVAAEVAVDTLQAVFARQPSSVTGFAQAVSRGELGRVAAEPGPERPAGNGHHPDRGRAGRRGRRPGRDRPGQRRATPGRYVFSGGRITQITADHSLAEEKVRHGELTEAEAAVHPHRHILTRALGVAADVEVDLWELHVQTGDRMLLCSDGLTNEVDTEPDRRRTGRRARPDEAARAW